MKESVKMSKRLAGTCGFETFVERKQGRCLMYMCRIVVKASDKHTLLLHVQNWSLTGLIDSTRDFTLFTYKRLYPCVQREEPTEPVTARRAGSDRAGLRQPPRGPVQDQASSAHTACLQGGQWFWEFVVKDMGRFVCWEKGDVSSMD